MKVRVAHGYLNGLQIGEEIRVSSGCMIYRMSKIGERKNMVLEDKRLIAMSAFYPKLEDLIYVAVTIEEMLRAVGEPFGLEYSLCEFEGGAVSEAGQKVAAIIRAAVAADEFGYTEGEGEPPEIPTYSPDEFDGLYFELVYKVVARPF